MKDKLTAIVERVRDGDSDVDDYWRERLRPALTSLKAKAAYFALGVLVVSLLVLKWSWDTRGPINTVFYAFVFLFFAALFPILIGLFGHVIPNLIGKLHLLLGAVAFDHHYLVQRENRWEWCPGERGRVWIDGEWHEIQGGFENYSVLAWRPFGILRYKSGETWAEKRADTKAERNQRERRGATTDGGETVVERGMVREVDAPIESGLEGSWVLDLKRVFTGGIRKFGHIELIETAEEVIERGQVEGGMRAKWGPLAETLSGLVLGVITAYAYVLLAG